MVWCGSTEVFMTEIAGAPVARGVREGARGERPDDPVEHGLRLRRADGGHPVRERRAEPDGRHARAAGAGAAEDRLPIAGKDFKTGQTLMKTIIAPGLKARLLGVEGWYSTNILGNRDGEVLDDPESFKTKEESKKSVLDYILQPQLYPELYKDLCHVVRINYYPPRGDNKEGWDNIDLFGLARLPDAAQDQLPLPRQHPGGADRARPGAVPGPGQARRACRASRSGCRSTSRARCTRPGLYPEHDLFIQLMKLKNTLRSEGRGADHAPRARV